MLDDQEKKHPAFGCLKISRTSGGNYNMFMSSLKCNNVIMLEISGAVQISSFGESRVFPKESKIEIGLTPAQFADAITNLNWGVGVPCTIMYERGEKIAPIEDKHDDMAEVKEYVDVRIEKFQETIFSILKELETYATKEKILKSDRVRISELSNRMRNELGSNMKFYEERMVEQMNKVVRQGKAEIEAAITASVLNAGMQAIKKDQVSLPDVNCPVELVGSGV